MAWAKLAAMPLWSKITIALVGSVVLGLGAAAYLVGGPNNLIGMIRYDQRRDGHLAIGDKAPDITLVALDGRTPVRLIDRIGGRPTVLIFGSFT